MFISKFQSFMTAKNKIIDCSTSTLLSIPDFYDLYVNDKVCTVSQNRYYTKK